MCNLGPASFIPGMEIIRDCPNRMIILSQRQYVSAITQCCGMSESRPVSTPIHTRIHISENDPIDNTTLPRISIGNTSISYASAVRCLMYAMMGTRPDIAYLVGILGRYSANPKACHWEILKRGFRYLHSTKALVLTFKADTSNSSFTFHGYSDADWSGDHDTSRSTSGYAFLCN